eukprot:3557178-Lingulodinium_polyedra.AAC.1
MCIRDRCTVARPGTAWACPSFHGAQIPQLWRHARPCIEYAEGLDRLCKLARSLVCCGCGS